MVEEEKNIQELPVESYNFANTTKWVFNIPFGRLFNVKYGNINNGYILDYPLNCKNVSFPEFKLGTSTVTFLNYSFEVSTRSNVSEKELMVTFTLADNWIQYLMLLKWFELCDFTRYNEDRKNTVTIDAGNQVQGEIAKTDYEKYLYESGANPYYSTQGPIVTTNLYLMDDFMNRKCTFNFEGCWLKRIKNVDLDYSKIDGTEVTATFTMAYYKFNIFNNSADLKKLFPDGSYLDNHDSLLNKMN